MAVLLVVLYTITIRGSGLVFRWVYRLLGPGILGEQPLIIIPIFLVIIIKFSDHVIISLVIWGLVILLLLILLSY